MGSWAASLCVIAFTISTVATVTEVFVFQERMYVCRQQQLFCLLLTKKSRSNTKFSKKKSYVLLYPLVVLCFTPLLSLAMTFTDEYTTSGLPNRRQFKKRKMERRLRCYRYSIAIFCRLNVNLWLNSWFHVTCPYTHHKDPFWTFQRALVFKVWQGCQYKFFFFLS